LRGERVRAVPLRGWSDVAAGRFHDVSDDDLDDFIAQLGIDATRTQQ